MLPVVLLALLQAAPPQPARQWPIESLVVTGNHNYTKEQILAVTGLKVGELAGKPEFEAAQHRLEETGAFETVGYKFSPSAGSSGYAATIQVVEVEPVYPIRFSALDVPDGDVLAWLKGRYPLAGAKAPATKAVLDRFAASIQELLAARGHAEKVMAKLEPVGGDQFIITFRPNRPEAAVAEVTFEGNQVIPTTELQNAVAGVAIGTAYTEASFRELLSNSAKPLYDARGRIRVAFPKITTEKAHTVDGLIVHGTVEEGPSFSLGEVTLDNKSEIKNADFLKAGNFKKGDVANFDDVNAGVERIRKRLRHDGYMRAVATVDRSIHDDKKTVDVTVHIAEGPKFSAGKLTILGLDLDGEAAMRKLWAMGLGKPFNPDYPDYFLAQIKERGLFDNLGESKAAVNVNEQNLTVDVTLTFHGAPTAPAGKRPEGPANPGPQY